MEIEVTLIIIFWELLISYNAMAERIVHAVVMKREVGGKVDKSHFWPISYFSFLDLLSMGGVS